MHKISLFKEIAKSIHDGEVNLYCLFFFFFFLLFGGRGQEGYYVE